MSAKVPSCNNLLRFPVLFSVLYGCLTLLLSGASPVHAQRVHPANPPQLQQPIPIPSLEQQLSRRLPPLVPGRVTLEGDLLVGLEPGANAQAFSRRVRSLGQVVGYSPALRVLRIKLNPTVSDNRALTWLKQQSETTYAENNHRIQVTSTPNDASYSAQWALPKIQADQAWDIWKPQGQVVLAIVDTGVDYTHPDLTNVIFRDTAGNAVGYDATGSGSFLDGYGHGTHVSGSAAAQINNGVTYQYTDSNNVVHSFGTAGAVGWNGNLNQSDTSHIKIMPVRVLDSSGSGSDAEVADGIAWAADHGAQVISMSLGEPEDPNNPGPPSTLNAAVQYAWHKGVVIVAAAGNDGSTEHFYPAACPNVISVAATNSGDGLADFSNFGDWVNVAAPGTDIYSTVPSYSINGNPAYYYSYSSGTSMATPHVAAEAAMLRAQNLTLTNQHIRDLIIGNVDPLNGGRTINGGLGGRVNFFSALSSLSSSSVRINSGGSGAGAFSSDQYYTTPGLTYSTGTIMDTSGVMNPAPQACYQSERFTQSGPLTYAIPNLTPGSSYTVRLHFAEVYWTAANQRVMNISLNGNTVQNNFDLVAEAGGRYKALVKEFTATADSSGKITVSLGRVQGDPALNALEVVAGSAPVVTANYHINSGGSGVGIFSADQYYTTPGLTYSTGTIMDTSGVMNPAPQACYQSERFTQSGPLTYAIPNLTPGSSYTVRLHFAEVYWTAANQRVMNISLNGNAVQNNFDLVAEAGGRYKALVKEFTATADSSGTMTISLGRVQGDPALNALEVVQASSGGPTPPPTIPAAPTNLTATGGSNSITLAWTASTGATSYNIKRSAISGGPYTTVATLVNTTSYVDGGQNYSASNNLATGVRYYYVVTAMNAAGESPNSNQASAVTTGASSGLSYHINSGGSAVGSFTSDAYYTTPGLTYSTGTIMDTSGVTNPAPQACYQSERFTQSGPLTYAVPNLTPGSSYTVRLHFAEVYWTAAGQRVMNISLNGNTVQNNFDLVAEAGGRYKALVKEFTAAADNNGTMTISLGRVQGDPALNALEVVAGSAPVVTANYHINSGGSAVGSFSADAYYTTPGLTYSTSTTMDTSGVTNPAPQACYQSERFTQSGPLTYAIPNLTPGSSYTVRLHFAEVYWTAANQRVMNISLNGNTVQNNFDLVAEAGGRYKALVKEFTVTADSNGTMTISLSGVQGDPALNALEVVKQ